VVSTFPLPAASSTADAITHIRRGTWLLAVRVVDDELWQQIKAGELTGFSIGGSALRSSSAA
jgi:hypothetical protein